MRKGKIANILRLLLLGIVLAGTVFLVSNWDYIRQISQYEISHTAPPMQELPDTPIPQQSETPANDGSNNSAPVKFDQIGSIRIESLGIQAPVLQVYEATERSFQAALIYGVVQYPGSAKFGEAGNPYIFGHSSDYAWSKGKYKSIFALLPKIELGAEIKVTDSTGKVFVYIAKEKMAVENDDLSVLDQKTNGKKILSVQTSYPVGTALKRYVVKAELVE